jgi:hypothetical protein
MSFRSDQTIFLIFLIVAAAVVSLYWHFSRSRSILESWAAQNGYEILESQFRNFFKGPFFWTSSRGQTVYYVKVRDQSGNVRTGWVRCGGWFLGMLSDKAQVRWED